MHRYSFTEPGGTAELESALRRFLG
jgi:hypothetical protein